MTTHYGLMIAGAKASGTVEVHSPYDQHLVGTVDKAGPDAIEQALKNAAEAHERHMRHMPAHERAAYLYKVAEQIQAQHEELSLTIAREGGKPLKDARVEVSRAINTTKMAADEALNLNGEQLTMDRAKGTENHLAFTIREGVGPVLAISAFNHPLNLICHQVCTAFAAGNSVIVKPASQTPISCLKLVGFFKAAGLPDGIINVVIASGAETEVMVKDARIRFITFIGSGAVGWNIPKLAAPGVRIALEHGGTATAIVTAKADLASTIPSLVRAGFYHAGQVCVHTQNLYVHESIYAQVLAELKLSVAKLKTGDPTDPSTDVGPIINAKELQRLEQWVADAVKGGAVIELGGKALGNQCYSPTLISNLKPDMKLICAEVFGPIVSIMPYSDINTIIADMNQSDFAFQTAIYTQDIDEGLNFARNVDSKAVMINDSTAFRVDWMPFGGKKHSGLGTGGVIKSIHEMTDEKLVVLKVKP